MLVALLALLAVGALLLHRAFFHGEILSSASGFVRNGPFPEDVRAAAPRGVPPLGDSVVDFVPWLHFAAARLDLDGRLPLWKDTAICGAPFLGNGQSALLFPPNFAAILLGAPPEVHSWIALFKIVVSGLGAWLLARHFAISFSGALVCGLTYSLGGFSILYLLFPLSNVSCLLPWLLLAAEKVVLLPTSRHVAFLAAIAWLQLLGGHPETAFHSQALVAVLALARIFARRATTGTGGAWRRGAAVMLGLLLGAIAGAVQVIPLFEYLINSDTLAQRRAHGSFPSLETPLAALVFLLAAIAAWVFSRRLANTRLSPWPAAAGLLLAILAMGMSGHAAGMWGQFVPLFASDWFGGAAAYQGPGDYTMTNLAFAGAAYPLVAVALLYGRPRTLARTGGALLVVLLLAGLDAPLLADLLHALPGFGVALNNRLLLFVLLATALLAGVGFDTLATRPQGPAQRLRLCAALLAPGLAAMTLLGLDIARGRAHRPPAAEWIAASRRMPAALTEEHSGASSTGVRVLAGWIAPPAAPAAGVLLHGRNGVRPLKLAPVPPSFRDRLEGAEGIPHDPYAFSCEIPAGEAPEPDAPVRVLVTDAGGRTFLSDLLGPRARIPAWLLRAPAPETGRARMQLALCAAASAACVLFLGTGGGVLLAGRMLAMLPVLLGLLLFCRPLIPTLPRPLFYPRSEVTDRLASLGPAGRLFSARAPVIPPEIAAFYGLKDVSGYDAIYPRRVARLLRAAIDGTSERERIERLAAASPSDLRLLGMMGVRFVMSRQPLRDFGPLILDGGPGQCIHENPSFLARARLVSDFVVEPDDDRALAHLRDPEFDLETRVVLASQPAGVLRRATRTSVVFEIDEPDHLRLGIETDGDALLILADTWYPGWRATVDGEEHEILRANLAFRAVVVHAGAKTVEFRYAPESVRLGLYFSGAGLLALLLLLVRRGRNSYTPATPIRHVSPAPASREAPRPT
ncbi:MAG: hypothetical protein HY812_16300 [Planctomycetes bacterium]|nr:hypothetical protein [Planctomycetota bacterium]